MEARAAATDAALEKNSAFDSKSAIANAQHMLLKLRAWNSGSFSPAV